MLLDTTFLIDLLRGEDAAVETAQWLSEDLVQQRLSAMTLFELEFGATKAVETAAERERIGEVLASKPIYPADTAVMRKAGRLSGELENEGTPIGDGDVIIAATAEILEEPVLTRNVGDFDRLDVDVETY